MALDDRLIKVTFADDKGEVTDTFFEDLAIQIVGQRTASPQLNQATVTIFNIRQSTRTKLATKYTPENLLFLSRPGSDRRDRVTIEIGRESYGLYLLFRGSVSTLTLTDPPDIALSVNLISNYFGKSDIISKNFEEVSSILEISKNVAASLNLRLSFNATDREVSNVIYNGDITNQTKMIESFGNIQCTIDNDELLVMDDDKARTQNYKIIDVNVNSVNELAGVPHWSATGVQFKMFASPVVEVGSIIKLTSIINPSVNDGLFKVVNLLFNVASREVPFYYDLFCTRFVEE